MITKSRYHKTAFDVVRETGLEPVRHTTHAPQTCLSASSSTLAFLVSVVYYSKGRVSCQVLFIYKKVRHITVIPCCTMEK